MKNKEKKEENNFSRPPVVVVLGHVDHGKSSLLEAVKDLKITEKEAGGITQHIGAYVVSHNGKDITFIDTPGHEAFFAMRSRGAKIADIGILVVAADESIKEQTKEAIKSLNKEKLPFLVAINKIDKKDINIEKVKQDLSVEGVFLESYGGKIPSVNVSAKKRTGIDELLEIIVLLAEMEGMEDKKSEKAKGVVLEAQRDAKKGIVATFLVKEGVLKCGDIVVAGCCYGKIRSMESFKGDSLTSAGPSIPVRITGIKDCPDAGNEFCTFEKIEEAKKISLKGKDEKKENVFLSENKDFLDIIIKADVIGSLEAIKSSLEKIPQSKIAIRVIREDVGNVTESDIECSKASNAPIFCFRTKVDSAAEKIAIRDGVEVNSFSIIYELIDSIKEHAKSMLQEEIERKEKGEIKILAIFKTQKNRQIIGGKIEKGEVEKGDFVEIKREGEKIGE